MKLRYHIRNAEHFVEFNFNDEGLQKAKEFRSNHPEFKRRKIREVLQFFPELITPGAVYIIGGPTNGGDVADSTEEESLALIAQRSE